MNDILAKKIGDNERSGDLYIKQMLATPRLNVSEFTKSSPFYLLYSKNIILPQENILKPPQLYYEDEHYEIALRAPGSCFCQEEPKEIKATSSGSIKYHSHWLSSSLLWRKWLSRKSRNISLFSALVTSDWRLARKSNNPTTIKHRTFFTFFNSISTRSYKPRYLNFFNTIV